MQNSQKTTKIERKRPLKSQWGKQNAQHTGKPNHRQFVESKRDPETMYA